MAVIDNLKDYRKPEILINCWGPMGQDGPLNDLRIRFGEWRRIGDGTLYGIHDREIVGFTFRVVDSDVAMYELTYEEYKSAFLTTRHDTTLMLATAHGNARYFSKYKKDKYLGVTIHRKLKEFNLL